MKTILNPFSFLFIFVILSKGYAQVVKKLVLGEQPIFKVCKTDQPIKVDGKMNEKWGAYWKINGKC